MEKNKLLKAAEKLTSIVEMSGIQLSAYDEMGNLFDVDPMNLAIMALILTRNDIADIEKAMMLYGSIYSKFASKIYKNTCGEA